MTLSLTMIKNLFKRIPTTRHLYKRTLMTRHINKSKTRTKNHNMIRLMIKNNTRKVNKKNKFLNLRINQ